MYNPFARQRPARFQESKTFDDPGGGEPFSVAFQYLDALLRNRAYDMVSEFKNRYLTGDEIADFPVVGGSVIPTEDLSSMLIGRCVGLHVSQLPTPDCPVYSVEAWIAIAITDEAFFDALEAFQQSVQDKGAPSPKKSFTPATTAASTLPASEPETIPN